MLVSVSHISSAWLLYYEILSRSQESVIPIMTHPCGEQYECLTVLRDEDGVLRTRISINLAGTAISAGNALLRYQSGMSDNQIKLLAQEVASAAGLRLHDSKNRKIKSVELYLHIMKTRENLLLSNAWYDGSYSYCLSQEAKAFPAYPVHEEQEPAEHIKWWVLAAEHVPVAVVSLETDKLILSSGEQYDLSSQYDDAYAALRQALPATDFTEVVNETRQLLCDNPEWRERYSRYAQTILENESTIRDMRSSFHEWTPLHLYMTVGKAIHAKASVRFELRYLGQTVAELHTSKGPRLSSSQYDRFNQRDFGCAVFIQDVPWDSPAAAAFRRFFKDREPVRAAGAKPNEEHRLESLLLGELSKTTPKKLHNMRPAGFIDIRSPLPTPLRASNHKQVTYAGPNGGGIDILVRAGNAGATNLCVIELKDENTNREPPREATKQALAYAVFLRELLRSEAGPLWWRLFGFKRCIPSQLRILAACAMPTGKYDDYSFAGLTIPIGEDVIELHSIFFSEEHYKITSVRSSLGFLNSSGE